MARQATQVGQWRSAQEWQLRQLSYPSRWLAQLAKLALLEQACN
jgi:hypothetical protein